MRIIVIVFNAFSLNHMNELLFCLDICARLTHNTTDALRFYPVQIQLVLIGVPPNIQACISIIYYELFFEIH